MFRRWLNPLQFLWLIALLVLPAAALTGVSLDVDLHRSPRAANTLGQLESIASPSEGSSSGQSWHRVPQEIGCSSPGCE